MKDDIEIFNVFGDGFDRFAFPGKQYRVTAGRGGEAILIIGSEKTAIIDCGMAYCGGDVVKNIKDKLAEEGRNTAGFCVSDSFSLRSYGSASIYPGGLSRR